MGKSRTRLMDIAAHAQVSTATVSRVINKTGPVSPETRHRVLTAIDKLGYERPSSDHSGSAPIIGIITPELTNPIFAAFAHAIQNEVTRAGAIPLIATQTPGATSEADYVSTLLERGADGLIFVSGRHADYLADLERYERLMKKNFPFVTINGARQEISAPDFSTDDALGIDAAVSHLVALGHTRIALLTGHTHVVPARRKTERFTERMRALFPDQEPIVTETFYSYEGAAAVTGELLEKNVTAIITGSDTQALGAIRTICSRGLTVPDDVSVVGFDDGMLMAHIDPPLTTIHQPVAQISEAAVRALFQQIGPSLQQSGSFTFTPDLVVRRSTARVSSPKTNN